MSSLNQLYISLPINAGLEFHVNVCMGLFSPNLIYFFPSMQGYIETSRDTCWSHFVTHKSLLKQKTASPTVLGKKVPNKSGKISKQCGKYFCFPGTQCNAAKEALKWHSLLEWR